MFEEQCAYYLAMGMTPEQYWDGDGMLCKYYREAYDIKRKQRNTELWLQGAYIYEALCDVAPVLQAFAKKGTKVHPYAEEPYALSEKEKQEREMAKEKAKMEKIRQLFLQFASSFNKKKRKEG